MKVSICIAGALLQQVASFDRAGSFEIRINTFVSANYYRHQPQYPVPASSHYLQ